MHTLHVPDANDGITDVWFTIRGANLDLGEDDGVIAVLDAGTVLEVYRERCREAGHDEPDVITRDH